MNNKIKNSLTFADALKMKKPVAFSTMIKPAGSNCNMDCTYCYYLDKANLYENVQPTMSFEMLEEYTRQYIEANDVPQVLFCWHGGEPLMAGIEYYRKAMEFQEKYKGDKEITNTLQTNGLLLNEEWCQFFHDHNFLLGISIDGPKDIHDAFRVNKGGAPTWDKVMAGVKLCMEMEVEYNTLSVVSSMCEGRGVEIYRFLKSIGSRFMQFLPAVEHVVDTGEGKRPAIVAPNTVSNSYLADWSVSPKGYGTFLNDIFDEWVLQDVGTYFVQMFDVALAQWVGAVPGLCAFGDTCGEALIVEHNGDVYSCDHFVYPQHLIGNIMEDELWTLFKSNKQFKFGINKRNTLPNECLRCKWYFACRGECPKHRFEKAENGELNKNTLCEAFKVFFKHVDPYMKYMAQMLAEHKPPALVMNWARQRMGF